MKLLHLKFKNISKNNKYIAYYLIFITIGNVLFFSGGYKEFSDISSIQDNKFINDKIYIERNKNYLIGQYNKEKFSLIVFLMNCCYCLSMLPLMLLFNLPSPREILKEVVKKIKKK